MAKRKAKKKTTTRRRRRIGAVALNKDLMMQAAGAIGGYVIGQMVASKIAPTMDNKIKGAILAAAGLVVVPMVMKNTLGKGLAIGMAVAGGQKVLQGFNIISGSGTPLMIMPAQGMGVRQIAGSGINAMVNGRDGVSAMVNGGGINQMVNGRSAMQTAMKYG